MFLGELNPFGVVEVLLALAAALDLILSTVLLLNKNRDRSTRFFILSAYSVTAWVTAMLMFQIVSNPTAHLVAAKTLYVCGIFITHFFLLFALEYLNESKPTSRFVFSLITFSSFAAISAIVFSSAIVADSSFQGDIRTITFGWAYPLYMVLLFMYVVVAYIALVRRALLFHITKAFIAERQIVYVIVGTGISIFVSLVGNIILPFFHDFRIHWLGPVVNSSFVLIMAYAIAQYQLFNLRIIATQLFVFALWITLFVRTVLSVAEPDLILNIVVLVASVFVGSLLIRTVLREVDAREQIERLAQDLKESNEKLKELDKLKSQFLSIATHELRTPLTIVRNFISLMLDGTYGKVNDALAEGGRQVFQRVDDMARSVDTYLNVSRIEQGKIKYDFAPANFSVLVETAYKGLLTNAEKKKLALTLSVAKGAESIRMRLDAPKITEVLINLIDNSIKYTPKGSVHLSLERVGQRARFTISDTGVGMTEKTQQNLFKLFSPGEDSKKINPASTGVGLYVSKAHIEAHRGTLTATSAGPGKGSQFIVELPL